MTKFYVSRAGKHDLSNGTYRNYLILWVFILLDIGIPCDLGSKNLLQQKKIRQKPEYNFFDNSENNYHNHSRSYGIRKDHL